MEYAYTATTAAGVVRRGTWDASSPREVVTALRSQGFLVLDVRERRRGLNLKAFWAANTARASALQRALLARHLALMLRSGLTVDRALQILVNQASRRGLRDALSEVHADIRRGEALSVACARFPRVFPPLFISILRWGEAGGGLAESLERLAVQLEKDVQLRNAVRGALIYPAIVVGATVTLGVVLSTFVLPRLLTVFESFQLELPLVTKIFLFVGRAVSENGVRSLLVVILLLAAGLLLARLPSLKPYAHRFVLRIPIVGRLVRDVNLARTERIFGSLVRSGLPIVEALAITSDTLTNLRYRQALKEVLGEAQRGQQIAGVLAKSPRLFPPIVSQMVAVGEETGKLQEVLLYLADFTEGEVAQATKNLATTIEPLLLVVIGLIVGGVALAVILPIYQLTGSFTR